MNINSKTAQGKAILAIALSGALISVTGFLGQSANAATPTQTPMPAGMVMPQTKPAAAPKVTAPKAATPKGQSTTKPVVATKPAPKVQYTLAAGPKFAKLKAVLGLSLLKNAKAAQTAIGTYTADKVGTFAFSFKSTIAKTATIFVTVKDKASVLFSAKLLKLATVGTIARPFVPPTPTAPLIPVPVPTPTPVVTPPTITPTTTAPAVALVPTLGTITPTKDGYIVQIANYDSAFTWTAKDVAGGTVFISSTGQITVTKLAASVKTSVTVTTTRNDYPNGSTTSGDITVLAADAVYSPPPPPPPSSHGTGGTGGTGGVITVTLKAPAITLSTSAISVNQLEAIPGYVIKNTGDAVTSYALSPAAPAGTTFNVTTGILSGAPTNAQANTSYTLTATNASGSSTAHFTLTVIAGINQQISYINPVHMRVGGFNQALQAAASSSLPVTYTVDTTSSTICSLVTVASVTEVHALAAGTCTIHADQAGAAPYFAAPQVTFAFSVIPAASTSSIVIIDPNGGTNNLASPDITSMVVAQGSAVTLPTLTNGALTLSWANGDVNGTPITSPFTPSGDITIVAKWA